MLNLFWKYLKVFLIIALVVSFLLSLQEEIYFSKLGKKLFGNKQHFSTAEKVVYANTWIYDHLHQVRYQDYPFLQKNLLYVYYRFSPMLTSISGFMAVEFGTSVHTGTCGSLSRVLKLILAKEGINSRRFLVIDGGKELASRNGHTMLEVEISKDYFAVFDPTFNLFWIKEDGTYAAKENLRDNPTLFEKGLHLKGLDTIKYPYRFDYPRYMRWDRLPFGINVATFLRDVLKIDVYRFPGFQFYDRSNLFLGVLFSILLVLAVCYEKLRANYISEKTVYYLSYFEIIFIVYVIPLFFGYQLLINANLPLNILIVFNLVPGFTILFISSIKLMEDRVGKKSLLFLFLFLFLFNHLLFVLSKSMRVVLFTGNGLTLSILLYLRYLKSNGEKRYKVLMRIFGHRNSYYNK